MPNYQGVLRLHDAQADEYYGLKKDPYQLASAVAGNPQQVAGLTERMKAMAACRGASCR